MITKTCLDIWTKINNWKANAAPEQTKLVELFTEKLSKLVSSSVITKLLTDATIYETFCVSTEPVETQNSNLQERIRELDQGTLGVVPLVCSESIFNVAEVLRRGAIAQRFKKARRNADMGRSRVAGELKTTRSTIAKIESGERIVSTEEIIQFANFYKVKVCWLMGDGDEEVQTVESDRAPQLATEEKEGKNAQKS